MSGTAANRREVMVTAGAALLMASIPARAVKLTSAAEEVDAISRAFLAAFPLPGFGVALILPGRPDFAAGYGVLELGRPASVDAHSRFAIASNTKAFTAAGCCQSNGLLSPVGAGMPNRIRA